MKYYFIFLIYPFVLFAQSESVNNSRFAFEADYAYSYNNNLSAKGANIGVSIVSAVDLGIEYINGTSNNKIDIETKGETFYAAYNIKNDKNCIKLISGYTQNSIKLDYREFDFSGVIFGIIYYRKIYESESLLINPGLGFTLGFLSMSGGEISGNFSNSENPRSLSLEVNFVSSMGKIVSLVIAPSLSKDLVNSNNSLMAGINLGLLFNLSHK